MSSRKDYKHSEETKIKISKKLKGRKVWNKGKGWSEKVKKNISIGRKGKGKGLKQSPELRFAIDNGRTLCFECHKKTDNYGRPKKNG